MLFGFDVVLYLWFCFDRVLDMFFDIELGFGLSVDLGVDFDLFDVAFDLI